MAKKVRFPLVMEDNVEVRSMEELRNHFSLSKVLGYLNDGKLVTWLEDRYENSIAEAVSEIDVNSEDVAKKICEIFDVEYDENAENEVEKAEERKRKMELLKQYPDCMDYSKKIDFVAFDQDDLYDLLDEDAEEIYLCGERFSIPLSKTNTKYIGILSNVEVVIDSKTIVDFAEKAITFKNCKFDSKYEDILKNVEATKKDLDESKESNQEDKLLPKDLNEEELKEFADNLSECVMDYKKRKFDSSYELDGYDNSIEVKARLFNETKIESLAKVKVRCKSELTRAVETTKKLYETAKEDLIKDAEYKYEDFITELSEFIQSEIFASGNELLSLVSDKKTKVYINVQLAKLKKILINECDPSPKKTVNFGVNFTPVVPIVTEGVATAAAILAATNAVKSYSTTSSNCMRKNKDIVEKYGKACNELKILFFDMKEKNVSEVKELLELCEIDTDNDDKYYFDIEPATDKLVEEYEKIILEAEHAFPKKLEEECYKIKDEYISLVLDLIKENF